MDADATVSDLWRFPVKSMLGEQLDAAELTEDGVLGDRAYAVVDVATGKVASAKSVKHFPDLFGCRATFLEPPETGTDVPAVRITLPDGTSVASDQPDCDALLSRLFGRKVRLMSAAPEDFTIDQYHPDIEDVDPRGYRDTVAQSRLGAAFFAEIGTPSPVPAGSLVDLFPVSVMTTSTLETLSALSPETSFDVRRFRMNILLSTGDEGFPENVWVGRAVSFADGAQLRVTMPDPRCVMPTLAQEDLPKDNEVLRTLVRHNRLDLGGAGRFPCAGAYAVVETPGVVRTGDSVAIA